jgi:hypothetical protein
VERDAYLRCRDQNLRLEQERLPQEEVLAALSLSADHFRSEPFADRPPSAHGEPR